MSRWEKTLKTYAKKYGNLEQRTSLYYSDSIIASQKQKKESLKRIKALKILFWHDFCKQTFCQLAREFCISKKSVKRYYREMKKELEKAKQEAEYADKWETCGDLGVRKR